MDPFLSLDVLVENFMRCKHQKVRRLDESEEYLCEAHKYPDERRRAAVVVEMRLEPEHPLYLYYLCETCGDLFAGMEAERHCEKKKEVAP